MTRNSTVTVEVNGQAKTFKHGDHVTFPVNGGGNQTLTFSGVEFVGYGQPIDFQGRDLKDKLVVTIPNLAPASACGTGRSRGTACSCTAPDCNSSDRNVPDDNFNAVCGHTGCNSRRQCAQRCRCSWRCCRGHRTGRKGGDWVHRNTRSSRRCGTGADSRLRRHSPRRMSPLHRPSRPCAEEAQPELAAWCGHSCRRVAGHSLPHRQMSRPFNAWMAS